MRLRNALLWSLTGLGLAGCAAREAPAPPPVDRVARVITGLQPAIAIKGEAPARYTLAERMALHKVPGVSIAVVDSGRIVWARGFGVKEAGGSDSVTPTTIFQAGSISKPTFAVGLMTLVQQGVLDLDQDVNVKLKSWKLPENRFTAKEKATLRRLLSHSAGLTVHGFPGYEAGTPVPSLPQVLNGEKPANTKAVRVDTFPGAIWRYSGGGTTIAQLLVMDVTGKAFPEFMRETVLEPAGMTHSTYEQPLPTTRHGDAATGHKASGELVKGKYHTYPEMAAAGLWTTPSDLAHLALELQRIYAGNPSRILNQATVKQMFTVQKAPVGIGYFLDGSGHDLEFSHGGSDEGFIAEFTAFAERRQGAFVMTNSDNGGLLIPEIMAAIAQEYGWPTHHPPEKTVVALDSAALQPYTGEYLVAGGLKVTVTVRVAPGKLILEATDFLPRMELLPESDSTFFSRETGWGFAFNRDRRGKVTQMTTVGGTIAKKVR